MTKEQKIASIQGLLKRIDGDDILEYAKTKATSAELRELERILFRVKIND